VRCSQQSTEFSKHVRALCVIRDTDVHKLGAKLGVGPTELLKQTVWV
jgi:hypothetical protein